MFSPDAGRRAVASLLVAVTALVAQQPEVANGPLLQFYADDKNGVEHTYVVDVLAGTAAVKLDADRIRVLGRFDDGRIVLLGGLPNAVISTVAADGTDRQVLVAAGPGRERPEFVDIQHGRVYLRFTEWGPSKGSLRSFAPGKQADGVELLDRVDQVLAKSIDGLFVLRGRSSAAELWFVPRQRGGARRIGSDTFDFQKSFRRRVALSPNRRCLAFGSNRLDGSGGNIVVLDTVAGNVLAEITGIEIDVSPLSSSMPTVELAWRDDRLLRYSRSGSGSFEWVDFDVRNGKEVATEPYGEIGVHHRRPPGHRDAARHAGAKVRVDERGIWFADREGVAGTEPQVQAPPKGWTRGFSGTLQVSPHARAAACFVDGRIIVVDGVHRRVYTALTARWQFPSWVQLPTNR